MSYFLRLYRFIRYNEHKQVTIKAFLLSAYYRFRIINSDIKKLAGKWGVEGEESPDDASFEDYKYAKKVAYAVNQVCEKTKWESKCLVRALTAQKLLADKGIDSTLYLGCKEDEKKMVAHAWIRCGEAYVTGGNGAADGYTVVEKFRAGIKNE